MKRLPNGHLLCQKCGKEYLPGDVAVYRVKTGKNAGYTTGYCRPCNTKDKRLYAAVKRDAHDARFGAPTAEESRRRAEARRRLEELADLRSVDFSVS